MFELLGILFVVGVDGMLLCCLKDSFVVGFVWLKIGMLYDVVGLVGFVFDVSGWFWVFVVLFNYFEVVCKGWLVLDVLVDWVVG